MREIFHHLKKERGTRPQTQFTKDHHAVHQQALFVPERVSCIKFTCARRVVSASVDDTSTIDVLLEEVDYKDVVK